MKDKFPEYYCEPNFDELWKLAVFVFDANVLLDLYRLSPKTSTELLGIMGGLLDDSRIWIPYQFAYEYHKNLSSVRDAVKKDYKEKEEELKKLAQSTKKALGEFRTRSGFTIEQSSIEQVVQSISDIFPALQVFADSHLERLDRDNLEGKISQLFAGNVGNSHSDPRIRDICTIGSSRYERGIPPGHKDMNKREKSDPYGDLVGWFQIIAQAKATKLPVILVTNDSKGNDWFLKEEGKLLGGALPELVKEMRNEADVDFYLYQTSRFMEFSKTYLESQVSDETIEEVENLQFSALSKRLIKANLGEYLIDEILGFPPRMRKHSRSLDLSGADLQNANLSGKDLEAANLQGAYLRGANLEDTQLQGASLRGAKLEGATIFNTDLRGADLRNVDLQHTDFFGADLRGARLQGANLREIDLEWQSLRFANLEDAILYRAKLSNASLEYALLQGANLQDAELAGATLPDGTIFDNRISIEKFTDPTHPEFAGTLSLIKRGRKEYGFDVPSAPLW